ncbi:MAG: STAS domain-containing protein [Pseudomonadota bacterium]
MAPSNALDLSVGEVRQCAVITLAGRLDHTTVDTFKTSIDEALNNGAPLYKGVVVDLTKLGFMSSAGLRMLLAARRTALEAGGRLCLIRPQGAVQEVLDVSNLGGLFLVFENTSDAVAALVDTSARRDAAAT